MKEHKTRHNENLIRIARIQGQVNGIHRMVEDGEYCIDIVTQIRAARSALEAVERRILHKHLDYCVADAMHSNSKTDADEKINEVLRLMKRM